MPCQATTSKGEWSNVVDHSRPWNFCTTSMGRSTSSYQATGNQEIPWIGQSVGAHGPEFGQAERRSVILADIAAARARHFQAEAHPARNDGNLVRFGVEHPEFGDQTDSSLLRDEQHFAVGIIEYAIRHRTIGEVIVRRGAHGGRRSAVATHGEDAIDEIDVPVGNGRWAPPQPVGCRRHRIERAALPRGLWTRPVGRMVGCGPHAIQPADGGSRWRGAVNAVPESCSAYRPCGARCGEFWPSGNAPGTASVEKCPPKPV